MNQLDSTTLGMRIREARERAGLTQSELAEQVSLDRTSVSKIEAGARKITALELSDVAQAVGARMAWFFAEPTPALVSHRSNQGLDTADSKIDRLLSSLAAEVEFVQSLAPDRLELSSPNEAPYPRPFRNEDAESLAAIARGLLELDDKEPVWDLVSYVSSIGLLAFTSDLGLDTADAGTILLREGAVCLINSHNPVGRRRLALAHELGHYLLADDYTVDWRVADQVGDIETALDRFARALLLPGAGLRQKWSDYTTSHETREAAVLAGSEFRVDMATLARRLIELGVVQTEEAQFIREVRTTRADIVEFGLNVGREMEETALPVVFQKAVLQLVREERISAERALTLLQYTFEEYDLPAHRTRRENELWNFVS